MGLETNIDYISELDADWPTGANDSVSQGDDHLRLIKGVLQTQFPQFDANPVQATPEELSYNSGLTSNVQEQLNGLQLSQGVGGIYERTDQNFFALQPSNEWTTWFNSGASSYTDGMYVTATPATGVLAISGIAASWVRLHLMFTFRAGSTVSPGDTVTRAQIIRGSTNTTFDGGACVIQAAHAIDDPGMIVIECIDPSPSQGGESYTFEMSQSYGGVSSLEVLSVHWWCEVVGGV